MKRILVVEDEPGIGLVIEDLLKGEGYQVRVVTNGLVAGEQLSSHPFDLILLDGMLPGKDGFDVCRDLRRAGVATPVIFLSARAQVADRVRGLDLGANDYVLKPFAPDELMARVRRHLQNGQLCHRQQHLEEEMRAASEVQQALFPRLQPAVPGLDYAAVCRPARQVSGDCYDFIQLEDGCLGLLVADVCGKGISAALLGAALHGAIRAYTPAGGMHPGEVFARVNRLLFENTAPERYATAFYGVYQPMTRRLTYANAGQYAPFVVRKSGVRKAGVEPKAGVERKAGVEPKSRVERLNSLTAPLGLFSEIGSVERSLSLDVNDWLLVATDGVPEARNGLDQEFGEDRLPALLRNHGASAFGFCSAALDAVAAFTGGDRDLADDLTVMAARVTGH